MGNTAEFTFRLLVQRAANSCRKDRWCQQFIPPEQFAAANDLLVDRLKTRYDGIFMSSPDHHQPPSAGSSDDLKGLDILLVEDARDVGEAVKKHLELLGAKVTGPAATAAEATGLLNEHPPDVALVDFHLRDGELSDGLVARLREQGVPVIMLSGSFEFPRLSSLVGVTFLEKPVSEAQLLAHLGPLIASKTTR